MTDVQNPVLSLRNVTKEFPAHGGPSPLPVLAVDDVSLDLAPGETLGLVGESGCGKTTLTRVILQLVEATSGSVAFAGQELTTLSRRRLLAVRKELQVVLQDPYASLNPRMRVRDILAEPLITHGMLPRGRRRRSVLRETVGALLASVGLDPSVQDRYPHEFSGGQRQRIGIARALALEPRVIICDEPVSALDVSVQAQILHLLRTLQAERGLSYLFVSHDLSVVRQLADRVAVMYLGQIVEIAETEELFRNPRHPYTQALLSAVPAVGGERRRIKLAGDPPSPANPPSGCRFRTRCPIARAECAESRPALFPQEAPGHGAACFFPVSDLGDLIRTDDDAA